MLKNFWYVVEWSAAVTTEPIKARVLGQDLVLYRGLDGNVVAMSDLCVHRGASLSDGWTEGGCIVCPYHAWKYDSDGKCVRIPAAGENTSIPKKARVDRYDTQELYGWVWVFMGDLPESERPPIPDFGPEFHQDGYAETGGDWMWDANYERIVENGTDVTHVNWVHSFATRDEPEVRDLVLEQDDWSCAGTLTLRPPMRQRRGIRRLFDKELYQPPDSVTTTTWYMPAMVKIHVRLPGLGDQFVYDANIPVDENTTRTLWIGRRNFFTRGLYNRAAKGRVERIFQQDADIVENQRPELLPWDIGAELHHKTDAVSVAYRKRRQELIQQGWGIDTDRQRLDNGRTVTVIPSPARRAEPELAHAWVLKETPTVGQHVEPVEPTGEAELIHEDMFDKTHSPDHARDAS